MTIPKKDQEIHPAENEVQTDYPTKKHIGKNFSKKFDPPISTPSTDSVKRGATQTPGLNQENTSDNEPLPLD